MVKKLVPADWMATLLCWFQATGLIMGSEECEEDGTTCTPEWNVQRVVAKSVVMAWRKIPSEQDVIGLPTGIRNIEF